VVKQGISQKEIIKMVGRMLAAAAATGLLFTFLVGCGENGEGRRDSEEASTSAVREAGHVHGGPGVGQKAAVFSLKDIEGNDVSVADIVGEKTLAVVFWGTWCDFCKAEIPALKKMQDRHKEKGFQIVSVAVKKDQAQPRAEFHKEVSDFAKDRDLNYTVLLDSEYEAVALYHLHGVPTIIVIDLEGNVQYTGHSAEDAERVVSRLLRA
jgi:peroxiredoxin